MDWFGSKCLAYANGRTCVGAAGHRDGEHIWKGVTGMVHTVRTTHIQGLIKNGLLLAQAVDGALEDVSVDVGDAHRAGIQTVESALEKAISDLRHAADELDAERLSCAGWVQR